MANKLSCVWFYPSCCLNPLRRNIEWERRCVGFYKCELRGMSDKELVEYQTYLRYYHGVLPREREDDEDMAFESIELDHFLKG